MKTEKIVMLIVGLFAVIAFVVLGHFFGGFGKEETICPTESPAPTEDPRSELIAELKSRFGGSVTEGEDFISLTFVSAADGNEPIVKVYISSGLLSMAVTRRILDDKAVPTEMFADLGEDRKDVSIDPDYAAALSEEIFSCLSLIRAPRDAKSELKSITDAVTLVLNGITPKTAVTFGAYIVSFEYSSSDLILTAVCEPA